MKSQPQIPNPSHEFPNAGHPQPETRKKGPEGPFSSTSWNLVQKSSVAVRLTVRPGA